MDVNQERRVNCESSGYSMVKKKLHDGLLRFLSRAKHKQKER